MINVVTKIVRFKSIVQLIHLLDVYTGQRSLQVSDLELCHDDLRAVHINDTDFRHKMKRSE